MISNPNKEFVQNDNKMSTDFFVWTRGVTNLDIITGTGSPEGNVSALQKRLYMDDAGTAGNILYIKRDSAVAGDDTKGWILV